MRPVLNRNAVLCYLLGLTFSLVPGVRAADLIWDNSAATAGAQDGGGTFTSGGTTWVNASTLLNQAYAAGDHLFFGNGAGTAGTVTISGTIPGTVGGLTFNAATSGSYTLTGGTLNIGASTITSNANASIASILSGSGGWTKAGAGTLTLSGSSTNSVSGALNLNAGTLALSKAPNSDSQLPQAITNNVTVNLGNGSAQAVLRLDRSNQISDTGTVLLFSGSGATAGILRLNGNADTVGTIRSTGGAGIIENGHATLASTLTVGNTAADSFSGVIQNGGAGLLHFVKSSTGALTLTGVNTFTGSTSVRNGQLVLADTGRLTGTSQILLNTGGTLRLLNGSAANHTDRVADSAVLSLLGGTLHLADDGSVGSYAESIGAVMVQAGASTLSTVTSGSGTTELTLASLERQTGATVSFQGTGLGESTQNRILITDSPGLGDNGLLGGWAVTGDEFAKYGAATGVTALTAADYELGGEGAWTFESNAKISAGTALTADRRVNSLNLATVNATILDLGGHTLRLESGGLLIGGAASSVITGGTLTGGSSLASRGEVIVHQNSVSSLEIAAAIVDNGGRPVSFVKSGAGAVKLSGTNTFSGGFYLNAGVLQIGSAGALPVTGAVAVEGGTLDLNGYDITVGALSSQALNTAGLITNTVAGAKTLTVGNGGGSSSFSGQLGANLNFTKTGNGSLVFNQSNASYTGVITVAQGTLVTGNPSSLGAATGTADRTVIQAGATLDISGGINRSERLEIAGHGVNGLGAVVLNSGDSQNIQFATLTGHTTLGVNIRYDFDNQLTGAGFNLTKIGVGELALEGANVQNLGDIHIKQGSVTWSGSADLGATGNTLYVDAGATAQFYNKGSDSKLIVLSGGTLRRAGTAGIGNGNRIEALNGLTLQAGASTVANSNSAVTFQLNALNRSLGATLNFDAGTSLGLATTDTLNTNGIIGGFAVFTGNTWAVSADTGTDVAVTGLATYNTNDFAAASNNVDVTSSQSPAAFTVNSLRFHSAGAKVLTLTGSNTVSSGGLLVTSTVGNNLTRITGGSLRGAANGDLVILQNNTSNGLTIESVIENNGTSTALTKSGGGVLTLAGNNTFSGGTFFVGGTLAITKLADAGDSNLGNSTGGSDNAWTFNTGRLQYASGATADATTARNILLLSGGGIIEVASASRTLTLSGVISSETLLTGEGTYVGTSVLTKEGAGILELAGSSANTSTGTTVINAGILRLNKTAGVDAIAGNITLGNNASGLDILLLAASHQIKDTSIVTINGTAGNAGIFRLAGQSETIGGLSSTATGTGMVENESGAANTGTLAVDTASGASYTFSGILRNGDGSGTDGTLAFTKKGAGTQILTGSSTYTGDTTVEAGVLQLGAGGTSGSIASASRVVLAGGQLEISRSNDYAFGNEITGNGALVHSGTGTTTLSNGSSTYTGTTEINAGVVLATNSSGSATGASAVYVNGGVLGGTGIIGGATVVRENGRLAPGDPSVAGGIGALTFGGDLTLKRQASSTLPVLTLQLGTINDLVFNDAAGISANMGNLAAYFSSQLSTYEAETGTHDRLTVNGTLNLEAGAIIAVDNSLGYTPKFGDVFDLMDWNVLNTAAAAGDRNWIAGLDLQLPALNGGLFYDTSLFASSGIIVVTPEPGRVLLLAFAAALLVARRRRSGPSAGF